MARPPRLIIPKVPLHVIQRGNNRERCFFSDEDYGVYLDKLKEYSKKYAVAIHAYVLMTNHVHILMTPSTEEGVSKLMQSLGRYYVRYINTHYQRTGSLWEGRFKSTLVGEEEYFFTVSRYIELNPVRAGMVKDPAEYPWSSYHGNALGKKVNLIAPHALYRRLGQNNKERQQGYKDLFKEQLDEQKIKQISDATLKGWVLGNDRFKKKIKRKTEQCVEPQQRGGDRKSKRYHRKKKNQLL